MNLPIISFLPPVTGVAAEFNTFRLGLKLAKVLAPGDMVLLVNRKDEVAFGSARVIAIHTGELWPLCVAHAARNHRELGAPAEGAPERLFAYLQRLFGPQIAVHNKKTTVLYLRRIK